MALFTPRHFPLGMGQVFAAPFWVDGSTLSRGHSSASRAAGRRFGPCLSPRPSPAPSALLVATWDRIPS